MPAARMIGMAMSDKRAVNRSHGINPAIRRDNPNAVWVRFNP
jgi:hypothetical protein